MQMISLRFVTAIATVGFPSPVRDTLWAPDTVVVGRNIQGWKRQKPLSGNSCVAKVNTTPTLVF